MKLPLVNGICLPVCLPACSYGKNRARIDHAGLRFSLVSGQCDPGLAGRPITVTDLHQRCQGTASANQEDLSTQQVFGVDADGLKAGQTATLDDSAFGYPLRSLEQCRP